MPISYRYDVNPLIAALGSFAGGMAPGKTRAADFGAQQYQNNVNAISQFGSQVGSQAFSALQARQARQQQLKLQQEAQDFQTNLAGINNKANFAETYMRETGYPLEADLATVNGDIAQLPPLIEQRAIASQDAKYQAQAAAAMARIQGTVAAKQQALVAQNQAIIGGQIQPWQIEEAAGAMGTTPEQLTQSLLNSPNPMKAWNEMGSWSYPPQQQRQRDQIQRDRAWLATQGGMMAPVDIARYDAEMARQAASIKPQFRPANKPAPAFAPGSGWNQTGERTWTGPRGEVATQDPDGKINKLFDAPKPQEDPQKKAQIAATIKSVENARKNAEDLTNGVSKRMSELVDEEMARAQKLVDAHDSASAKFAESKKKGVAAPDPGKPPAKPDAETAFRVAKGILANEIGLKNQVNAQMNAMLRTIYEEAGIPFVEIPMIPKPDEVQQQPSPLQTQPGDNRQTKRFRYDALRQQNIQTLSDAELDELEALAKELGE